MTELSPDTVRIFLGDSQTGKLFQGLLKKAVQEEYGGKEENLPQELLLLAGVTDNRNAKLGYHNAYMIMGYTLLYLSNFFKAYLKTKSKAFTNAEWLGEVFVFALTRGHLGFTTERLTKITQVLEQRIVEPPRPQAKEGFFSRLFKSLKGTPE